MQDTTLVQNNKINTSSIEMQRQLRIEKINKLRELGFDPFKVESYRDFSIDFVKFWFGFVHIFDVEKLEIDENNYMLEHYLAQAIFPQTLVETMEEKIQFRHTARQMGIDPDDQDSVNMKFDDDLINEIRVCIPGILQKTQEQKEKLLYAFLTEQGEIDHNGDIPEPDGLVVELQKNQIATLCGRVKTKRISGKIAFVTLEDESCPDGFQIVLKKDDLDSDIRSKLLQVFDPENIKNKLKIG